MIEAALSGQDQRILSETEELGCFALGFSQFRGKLGWVTWVIMSVQITLFAISIWCAIRFFGSTEPLEAIKWGIPGGVLMLMATLMKLSLWPQMQADRVIREVKRLELLSLSQAGK